MIMSEAVASEVDAVPGEVPEKRIAIYASPSYTPGIAHTARASVGFVVERATG